MCALMISFRFLQQGTSVRFVAGGYYRVWVCASCSQPPLPGAFITAASLLQISVLRGNTALPAKQPSFYITTIPNVTRVSNNTKCYKSEK
uniref:Putative secreted protein n=1 Tax=Anopheles marajoara TaxID=58244 RepID=A0A2M4CAK1_9DIPT